MPWFSWTGISSLVAVLGVAAKPVVAAEAKDALDFRVNAIDGTMVDLGQYRGNVVLIVNTASRCGLTPQYSELQELWVRHQSRGLVVLGFPSNDFLWQEPGSNQEIREFCSLKYRITFPMFEKIAVKGQEQAPLYSYLTSRETKPEGSGKISWNFEKFLIGRDGMVASRFAPKTNPDSPEILSAIEKELSKVAP